MSNREKVRAHLHRFENVDETVALEQQYFCGKASLEQLHLAEGVLLLDQGSRVAFRLVVGDLQLFLQPLPQVELLERGRELGDRHIGVRLALVGPVLRLILPGGDLLVVGHQHCELVRVWDHAASGKALAMNELKNSLQAQSCNPRQAGQPRQPPTSCRKSATPFLSGHLKPSVSKKESTRSRGPW